MYYHGYSIYIIAFNIYRKVLLFLYLINNTELFFFVLRSHQIFIQIPVYKMYIYTCSNIYHKAKINKYIVISSNYLDNKLI